MFHTNVYKFNGFYIDLIHYILDRLTYWFTYILWIPVDFHTCKESYISDFKYSSLLLLFSCLSEVALTFSKMLKSDENKYLVFSLALFGKLSIFLSVRIRSCRCLLLGYWEASFHSFCWEFSLGMAVGFYFNFWIHWNADIFLF